MKPAGSIRPSTARQRLNEPLRLDEVRNGVLGDQRLALGPGRHQRRSRHRAWPAAAVSPFDPKDVSLYATPSSLLTSGPAFGHQEEDQG
jgi:hypothetical protein